MQVEFQDNLDIEEIFDTFKEPDAKVPRIDVIIENYLSVVSQLKKDLSTLKDDLTQHRKSDTGFTDSLAEYLRVQSLSSIITQHLELSEIWEKLEGFSQTVVPLLRSEIFLWEDDKYEGISQKNSPDFKLIVNCAHEEGIIKWLYEQKHPVVVPLSDFMIYDKLRKKKGNVIIIPLLDNDQGIGVFIVLVEKNKSSFSIRDLEYLNVLAQQAALAIIFKRMNNGIDTKQKLLGQMQTRFMKLLRLATVGELAGGIAHEINNPLQIIMGNVQMARMGHKLEESLGIIEKQSVRIANIVRGLLNMARQDQESFSEFLEINPLIVNTVNLIRGQMEKREIQVELDLKNKIPAIQGNSIYFQQILLNFLLHAKMQINHNGSIAITTRVEDDEWIVLEISDSGVPMPSEYIEKVIDPFSELENSQELNLGLTVSVQMVQEIGGEVEFQPQKKTGNRIIIKIPIGSFDSKHIQDEVVSTG
ncbi:MAG: GAF domain-containing protein [bacterium]|nr:MAG: GAF domain-containing protein [bacterium]